jgi:SOS-response transcriptional repressor LexA
LSNLSNRFEKWLTKGWIDDTKPLKLSLMHILQEKLLRLATTHNLGNMTLREIGELIGEKHPQIIKHHLNKLEQKGLVTIDRERRIIRRIKASTKPSGQLISIPILGSVDCGPATVFADENVQGFLNISSKFLRPKKGLFALKAVGHSMDRANVEGRSIEDGDYVIVDSEYRIPRNKDYVISVIDGVANIKRFIKDERNQRIILLSESTHDFPPIVIHPDDIQYLVCGKVIQIVKKPEV